MKNPLFFCAVLGLSTTPLHAVHQHYAAGVTATGTQLQLYNIPTPAQPGQPAVTLRLEGRISGQLYAGYSVLDDNSTDGFTFTSRYAAFNDPNRAANNSDIWMEIVSIVGPAGGRFGFWEQYEEEARVLYFNTPSNLFTANQPTGGFRFPVSEHIDGDPEPGGHIHFRAWTVDAPGNYDVSFRLVDLSGQQTPSATYLFRFAAVPEPGSALLLGGGLLLLAARRGRR